ncbi:ABC transporter substrate-binding protein/permease [Planctomycetota bacterium]
MPTSRCLVLVIGFLLALQSGVLAQSAEAPQEPDREKPLRVALTGRYPPFSFYDSRGQLQGFDVDVSREVACRLQRPVQIITTEWAGIIPGLQSGRYDAIIGSMAITPQRQKAVLFSRPYYVSGAQLFVRKADTDKYANLNVFTDELIGVGLGTTFQQFLSQHYPNMRIRTYPGEPEIFQDMRTGRLTAFVTDRLVGMYNARRAGEDFVPAGPLLYKERCAIPVTFENAALAESINRALDAMEREGFLTELHRHWFSTPEAHAPDVADLAREITTPATVARVMLRGFGVTLLIAALAVCLGFAFAVPIGVGIKSGPRPLRWLLVGASDFIRGTPLLVQLFFVYYGLGQIELLKLSPLQAGALTLTVNASAYMAEVVRAGLTAVPNGQALGAMALGLTRLQAFRHVIWPQAFRIMIPPLVNSVVALVKDTALVSVISVAEMVTETNKLVAVTYQPTVLWALVAVLFFVVAFPLMKAAQRWEARLQRRGYETEK